MRSKSTVPLEHKNFAKLVNSKFKVSLGERDSTESIEVQLVEADVVHQQAPCDVKLEAFTLLFKGEVHQALPQSSLQFSHEKLGDFELFITPVHNDDTEARYYEAVFNRIVS